MLVVKLILLSIIMGIIPLLLGNFVQVKIGKEKASSPFDLYAMGFLVMLATFQLVCIPFAFLYNKFHILVIVYSFLLVILCLVSIRSCKKIRTYFGNSFKNYSKFEWIYLAIFIILMCVQLYYAVFYETSYMSLDDYEYIVISSDIIADDSMFITESVSGNTMGLSGKRALNSYLAFIAYVSKVTDIHVTTVAHTVFPVILLIVAYIVYHMIARYLFEERENQLIFLMLVAVANIFGLYSFYSMTFRLLGPIWQGKAVLMIIVIPFLFAYLPSILSRPYNRKDSLILMMVSMAGCSLSMMAAGMIPIVICCYCAIFFLMNRERYILLYAIWGGIIPALHFVAYLLMR